MQIKKFDYVTASNDNFGDFQSGIYSKIMSIPLNGKHYDNYAGDITTVFEIFWIDNYHSVKYGKYSLAVRQDLKSCLLYRIDEYGSDTYFSNGVGYVITTNSIDVYARCGAQYYQVRVNIVGTSSENIFTECLAYEPFQDITVNNITLTYATDLNNNTAFNSIYPTLVCTAKSQIVTSIANNTTLAVYSYTATQNTLANLNMRFDFVANANTGTAQMTISTSKSKTYFKQIIVLSASSDSYSNFNQLIPLDSGETITVNIYQSTNASLTVKLDMTNNI